MESYVVKYHPEGWMSVKEDGLPKESGLYIVTIQTNMKCSKEEEKWFEEEGWDPNHAFDHITAAWFNYDAKLWTEDNEHYNALLTLDDVEKEYVVTYWQPLPTAPWKIFPK